MFGALDVSEGGRTFGCSERVVGPEDGRRVRGARITRWAASAPGEEARRLSLTRGACGSGPSGCCSCSSTASSMTFSSFGRCSSIFPLAFTRFFFAGCACARATASANSSLATRSSSDLGMVVNELM